MIKVSEAAKICGVSNRTIYRAIKDGSLKATRPRGYMWLIDEKELQTFLKGENTGAGKNKTK